MVDRNYIFDRIRSGGVTTLQFDFDSLQAPPLHSLIPPQAIAELHSIAKSVKYSSNLELKYKLIDDIMRQYGFKKLIAGTNRVAYTYLEDGRFLAKVAVDAVGLNDNPAEFKNQFKLKPFVTKVFEVSACGTVGLFERVKPITNTEEYISVCGDYYKLINSLIGEFVMDDIGTHYFMNVGVRYTESGGWGPVILDFPYVYELDGNKLFCNAPAKGTTVDFSINGTHSNIDVCDGEIIYDAGYNNLICSKCGKKYKAIELGKSIKENKIIVREREGKQMFKVSVSGGDHAQNKSIVGNPDADKAKSIPNMHVNGVVTSVQPAQVKNEEPVECIAVGYDDDGKTVVKTEMDVPPMNTVTRNVEADNERLKEYADQLASVYASTLEGEEKKSEAASTIGFAEEDTNALELIRKHINEILSLSGLLSDEDAKIALEEAKGLLVGLDRSALKPTTEEDYLELFKKSVDDMNDYMDNIEDYYLDALKYDKLTEFIGKYYFIKSDLMYTFEDGNDAITANSTLLVYTGEEPKDEDILYTVEDTGMYKLDGFKDETVEEVAEDEESVVDDTVEELDDEEEDGSEIYYSGITTVNGIVTNAKDLIPTENSSKIIVLSDNDGNYIVDGEKNVIAIDMIDNKSFNKMAIVPSAWLEKVQDQLTPDTEVEDKSN